MMKRMLMLLLSILLIAGLTACTIENPSTSPTSKPASTSNVNRSTHHPDPHH